MAKINVCNKCGQPFDVFDNEAHQFLLGRLGYGSKYDGDAFHMDLCCTCVDELIDDCKISPLIERSDVQSKESS